MTNFYFDIITSRDAEPQQVGPFDSAAEAEQARRDYLESLWAPCASLAYEEQQEQK